MNPTDMNSANRVWLQAVFALVLVNSIAVGVLGWHVRQMREVAVWSTLPEVAGFVAGAATESPPPSGLRVEVFFDLTCEICRESMPAILEARSQFPDAVLDWVLRPIAPPEFLEPEGFQSGLAMVCAAEQGREWDLFRAAAAPMIWNSEALVESLARASLDGDRFHECVSSERARSGLWASRFHAASRGITGTPTLVAGGIVVEGLLEEEPLLLMLADVVQRFPRG